MKFQTIPALAVAFVLVAPLRSHAALAGYSQNFETLAPSGTGYGNTALSDNGWLVYANVFRTDGTYDYGYGPFLAPNGDMAFSGIAIGQGGPQQGDRQLVVYSDYNNGGAHASGELVESLVFQQQTIGAWDVGNTWTLRFDAGRYTPSPLAAPSTAMAFVKTLDPANGYQATGMSWVDMSAVDAWGTHSLSLTITAGAGQILQFGFANTATNYANSAVVYDNISFAPVPERSTYALMLAGLGLLGLTARRRKP
jgi:hypothetical protein